MRYSVFLIINLGYILKGIDSFIKTELEKRNYDREL